MKKRKEIYISDDLIITKENVQVIGEKIAVSALQKRLKFDYKYLRSLYNELIKSLNTELPNNQTISSGYEIAQEAICFLCNFIGHKLGELCIRNIHGELDCIRLATFKVIYNYLRKRVKQMKEYEYEFEITCKRLPIDIEFEEEINYYNINTTLRKMNLTKDELKLLRYLYNDMLKKDIANELHIDISTLRARKKRIKNKYLTNI